MKTRLTETLGIEVPIVQAPMAGSSDSALAIEVARAGGLGSLPCALLNADAIRREVGKIRQRTQRPINLNFFCHRMPVDDAEQDAKWASVLAPYHAELGVARDRRPAGAVRAPFASATCEIVEDLRPAVISFQFGMPDAALVERVRATGATILASATSVDEARWLEDHGADVVIAQGAEAGGHRAMFLTSDVAAQVGTMALVPQVVDAVTVPVIATGGIADARGIAAALMLGADGVQIGTGFLLCPEAITTEMHRRALQDQTETRIGGNARRLAQHRHTEKNRNCGAEVIHERHKSGAGRADQPGARLPLRLSVAVVGAARGRVPGQAASRRRAGPGVDGRDRTAPGRLVSA